jgi:glycine betaine catabolism B
MNIIDNFLNSITMYRLMLYFLIMLVAVGLIYSLFGFLPFSFLTLSFSVAFIISISWLTNSLFAKIYEVPTNVESVYISALILSLIISPAKSVADLIFLGWAAIWTMASKYIFAVGKKHIFNPVAFAVTLTAIAINGSASWWVGTKLILPFVLLGGLLIVKKIRRTDLVLSFLYTSMAIILGSAFIKGTNILNVVTETILNTPLLFFAFVMLTEPLTTPPTKQLQIFYGMIVGFLYAPQTHIYNFYTTPEIALVMGNIFSYLISPKTKLILNLKEKLEIAPNIYDFIFPLKNKINFTPGQYMEWTLAHDDSDNRGNRRYFTLASSPTESNLRIGVRFNDKSSSFKKSLISMDEKSKISVSQIAGDFTLPTDLKTKCVLIAGGIGITPYRSMLKHLLDTNTKRPIVIFYSNRTKSEIVYQEIFSKAEHNLGIKTVYTITDREKIPVGWAGKVGRIDDKMIMDEVPDFRERIFYLSGPHSMVSAFENTLKNMGIKNEHIKTDFFPGLV